MAKKKTQVADLSQDPKIPIPEDINPTTAGRGPSVNVDLPEASITPPSPFEEPTRTQVNSMYDVVCPRCKSEFSVAINKAERPPILTNVQCANPTCHQVFTWDDNLKVAILAPDPTVLAEALEGIDKALNQEVLPEIFETVLPQIEDNVELPTLKIGTVVHTTHDRGIIVSYIKFVKYMYGIINIPNPNLAGSFISYAGKNKMFQMLNITDKAEQEKLWKEFKKAYNQHRPQ